MFKVSVCIFAFSPSFGYYLTRNDQKSYLLYFEWSMEKKPLLRGVCVCNIFFPNSYPSTACVKFRRHASIFHLSFIFLERNDQKPFYILLFFVLSNETMGRNYCVWGVTKIFFFRNTYCNTRVVISVLYFFVNQFITIGLWKKVSSCV